MNQILWHIHLYKCGGTSLREWLKEHFGAGYYSDGGPLDSHVLLRSSEWEEIARSHRHWLRCYSSHRLTLECLRVRECMALTVVRNPVDRFLSLYWFSRSAKLRADSTAKSLSLDEFVHDQLVELNSGPYVASQLNHLSAGKGMEVIRHAVDSGGLILLPLESIQSIPGSLGGSGEIPTVNTTERGEASEETLRRIEMLCQSDMFLWEYAQKVGRRWTQL